MLSVMEPITTSSSVLAGVASANRATVILATGADLRANVLENDSMRDIIVNKFMKGGLAVV